MTGIKTNWRVYPFRILSLVKDRVPLVILEKKVAIRNPDDTKVSR